MTYKTRLTFFLITALAIGGGAAGWSPTMSAQVAVKPTPTPTPTAPTLAEPTKAVQTLASLQSVISARLARPEVRRGRVGVKIVSLNTGKTVYEQDADKYFMPASNMKNFTVATALEKLGPDFRYVTSVKAASQPDSQGVVHGPLVIVGRGDVSASTSFDPAFPQTIDHYKAIDALAAKIAAAGVRRVDGDLIADESYFRGFPVPETWEWDDIEGYDGTEISAFPLNDNAVDITVNAGSANGPCLLGVKPANQLVRFINNCFTTASGAAKVTLRKSMDQNIVTIGGTFPVGGKEFVQSIAFTHPAELYITLLKERLQLKGVTINGIARTVNKSERSAAVDITNIESPPFSVIAAKTMKPSQNNYTETILWTLGENERPYFGDTIKVTTEPLDDSSAHIGLFAVRNFLTNTVHIPADAVVQHDGSGLSRHDLITPNAVVSLYNYMSGSRYAQAWRDALSIAGVDGTLRNRFKGTVAAGNFRGKTGTIDQVSALSGYMTTAGGEPVIVSIIVNDVPEPRQRTSLIDDITIAVANFDGKID
jgi:D-alanyl-D-alanine carboxypeptidase/D-alanyl-D-alanine-endopeptidase (penicillin-binding protein 4)